MERKRCWNISGEKVKIASPIKAIEKINGFFYADYLATLFIISSIYLSGT